MSSQTQGKEATTMYALFEGIAREVKDAGVFDDVRVTDSAVVCVARDVEAPAEFRVVQADGRLWVGFYTPDRWLSQSIEADLVHTGDKLEDLIDEELVDLGCDAGPLPFEHFRDDAMEYVFRSPLPVDDDTARVEGVRTAAMCLMAYEAAFRELGDMKPDEDD